MIGLIDFYGFLVKLKDKRVGYRLAEVEELLKSKGLWGQFEEFMQGKDLIVDHTEVNHFIKPNDLNNFINVVNKRL